MYYTYTFKALIFNMYVLFLKYIMLNLFSLFLLNLFPLSTYALFFILLATLFFINIIFWFWCRFFIIRCQDYAILFFFFGLYNINLPFIHLRLLFSWLCLRLRLFWSRDIFICFLTIIIILLDRFLIIYSIFLCFIFDCNFNLLLMILIFDLYFLLVLLDFLIGNLLFLLTRYYYYLTTFINIESRGFINFFRHFLILR